MATSRKHRVGTRRAGAAGTRHYTYACQPDGGLLLSTYDPTARQAVQSWAGAGMAGLDSDDASFYGAPHIGDHRAPHKMPRGHTRVDYERTTWTLTRSGATKLRRQINAHIDDPSFYAGAEKKVARELLTILKKCR